MFYDKRLYGIVILFVLTGLIQCNCKEDCIAEFDLYGKVSSERYLFGRFVPYKNPDFVSLAKMGIPTNKRAQYLRKEAAAAIKRLYDALKKDHPKAVFWIRSSTRNWNSQKYIWESKWNGRTLVRGKKLNETIKDPLKRALKILEYSSMPGTSRHHWGSDFDINELYNGYYNYGNGAVVYGWMKKNARRFGFCQPYTAGREKGYKEERWHWSYMPLAKFFLRDWKRLFMKNKRMLSKKGLFKGSEYAGSLAPIYVFSINTECQ